MSLQNKMCLPRMFRTDSHVHNPNWMAYAMTRNSYIYWKYPYILAFKYDPPNWFSSGFVKIRYDNYERLVNDIKFLEAKEVPIRNHTANKI